MRQRIVFVVVGYFILVVLLLLTAAASAEQSAAANQGFRGGENRVSNETTDHYKEQRQLRVERNFFGKKDKNPVLADANVDGRGEEDLLQSEPQQSDVLEAIKHGMLSMKNLYEEKEPQLYAMGLFLSDNNPAHFVASFNEQRAEHKKVAKMAYAAIEATKKFRNKFPSLSRQALKNTILNTLEQTCQRRDTPICPPASRRYRTADGSCNNLKELWWGSAMSTMQRFLPPVYDDGVESVRRSIAGLTLPSARRVSDVIHKERDIPLGSITHMLMQWGQFIDHDVTATGQSRAFNGSVPQCCLKGGVGFQPPEFMHPDCLPIEVDPDDGRLGDVAMGGLGKGVRCLEFVRSGPAQQENSCEFGPREQLDQVTSFLDASTIYSSNAQQSDSLRIFRNGLMQYGKLQSGGRPFLPRRRRRHDDDDDDDICSRGSLSTGCFRAGDGRLSEQPALIALHVVFLRLHNHLAARLSAINPHWTDERLFQEARKIVGAIVQHITYHEFLPIVLGQKVLKTFDLELVRRGGGYYNGYDPAVNPNVANAFSSAAYRFGHSLVQGSFVRFDRKHRPHLNNVSIHEEFANPVNLETAGSVDRILLGLISQPAQRRDEFITEELTTHLFQTPGFPFGMDLAALNIQRGRDHGIAPFAEWRRACALNRIGDWRDLERIMSAETVQKFKSIYAAVEDIDLFSAGLAERPLSDGLVGPTFACIIAQQFRNLRKGDRFWYENPFTESSGFRLEQLDEIRRTSLAQILCSTLGTIDDIQPFVMLSVDQMKNRWLPCNDSTLTLLQNLDSYWLDSGGEEEPPQQRSTPRARGRVEAAATSRPRRRRPQQQQERPSRTRINQQNRVNVFGGGGGRPLRPPVSAPAAKDNLTIVISNNAVYSPVYVKDASVYGSHQLLPMSSSVDRRRTIIVAPNEAAAQPIEQSSSPLVAGTDAASHDDDVDYDHERASSSILNLSKFKKSKPNKFSYPQNFSNPRRSPDQQQQQPESYSFDDDDDDDGNDLPAKEWLRHFFANARRAVLTPLQEDSNRSRSSSSLDGKSKDGSGSETDAAAGIQYKCSYALEQQDWDSELPMPMAAAAAVRKCGSNDDVKE